MDSRRRTSSRAGAADSRRILRAPGGPLRRTARFVSNTNRTPTVFTIGYEQHAEPSSLVDALRTAGVRRLVDVRELPLSRRRGFSKTALAAALATAEIEYQHVREL